MNRDLFPTIKRFCSRAIRYFRFALFFTSSIIIFHPFEAHSQAHDIRFEELSIEEGLSQTICECIAQDNAGYMWFGTEDGLNKYDGYRFVIYRHNPEDPNSIAYNHILALHVDSARKIWIGTFDSGLDMYDPDSGIYTPE
jgi:ligand-binding sensor domain-containing protein